MKKKFTFVFIIILVTASFSLADSSEEDIEDMVDIFLNNKKIFAVISEKNTLKFNLRSNEEVLWTGAKGYIGSFITNLRFLAVSSVEGNWNELPLRVGESPKLPVSVSENIIMAATDKRIISFSRVTNRFIYLDLLVGEIPEKIYAEKNTGIIVTASKIYGFSKDSSSFKSMTLRSGEEINNLKISSDKASLMSSQRLLIFENGNWKEERL